MNRTAALLTGLVALGAMGRAQEFSVLVGGMNAPASGDTSYSWQIDFRQNLSRHTAWSVSWLNEGHVPGHHRDGWTAQAWGRLPLGGENFALSLGVGTYRYFDTQLADHGDSLNIHGWAPFFSLEVTYHTNSPWFYQLRANRAAPPDPIAIDTLAFGVGYQFGERRATASPTVTNNGAGRPSSDDDFTVYAGRTIVNTRLSGRGLATSLEYRRGLGRYVDWTASLLNEGDPTVVRRGGVTTQLWLASAHLDERLAFSFGFGVYAYVDRERPDHASHWHLAPIMSPSVAYRFSQHWSARFTWHRVSTAYHRDSDVFLFGLGYRGGR